jgi:hypothetical protein
MPTECRTADEGFRKGLLFMTEVSRDIRAEHNRLEKAGLLGRFYQRTDVGQGFFYAGVQASLAQAKRLHEKGKLSLDVVESWESLFRVACDFREKRAAVSSGD